MTRKISRIAVLAAILTAVSGTRAAYASAPGDASSDENAATVRILNNYRSAVRVFIKDSEGRLHRLGRVVRLGLVTFDVPADMVAHSADIELVAYPVALPAGFNLPVGAYPGVETGTISLKPGQLIDFWLEPDLSSSTASVEL